MQWTATRAHAWFSRLCEHHFEFAQSLVLFFVRLLIGQLLRCDLIAGTEDEKTTWILHRSQSLPLTVLPSHLRLLLGIFRRDCVQFTRALFSRSRQRIAA